MKIYSSALRLESDVFAISVSFDTFWPVGKRVVFYVEDKNSPGLFAEELAGATILDATLLANFKIHFFEEGDGLIFLWDYFENIDHFRRLIDFDLETMEAFEKARANFPAIPT